MEKISVKAKFVLLFTGLVLFDSILGNSGFAHYRFLTKPLILFSLIIYFAYYGRALERSPYVLMLFALLFSLLGDVFLLFDHVYSSFFIFGLLSFLTAHLLYCSVFIKKWSASQNPIFWLVTGLFVIYGVVLFLVLKDSLGSLIFPVVVYILGILAMAVSAYGRKKRSNAISFNLVFLGALFFVASDSILALDRFIFEVPGSNFLVMGTYATAQYLIVQGILVDD